MDLFEAFALRPGAIVAAVGGGGKTSLIYRLAEEAAGRGLSALVSSTTKFTQPHGRPAPGLIEAAPGALTGVLANHLGPGSIVTASAGPGSKHRLLGYPPGTFDRLQALDIGLVALEADGSAGRHLKAPDAHEPVIPAASTDVVVCAGLDVIGKPLDEAHVHRLERVLVLAEASPGEPVTADVVVRVLSHEAGGRKGIPASARAAVLLNAPPTTDHVRLGEHIAQRLVYAGYRRAVVATAHRGEVHAVVT